MTDGRGGCLFQTDTRSDLFQTGGGSKTHRPDKLTTSPAKIQNFQKPLKIPISDLKKIQKNHKDPKKKLHNPPKVKQTTSINFQFTFKFIKKKNHFPSQSKNKFIHNFLNFYLLFNIKIRKKTIKRCVF